MKNKVIYLKKGKEKPRSEEQGVIWVVDLVVRQLYLEDDMIYTLEFAAIEQPGIEVDEETIFDQCQMWVIFAVIAGEKKKKNRSEAVR